MPRNPQYKPNYLRTKKWRERQKKGVHCYTIEIADKMIANLKERGFIQPEDTNNPWKIIGGVYATQISDDVFNRLLAARLVTYDMRPSGSKIMRQIAAGITNGIIKVPT